MQHGVVVAGRGGRSSGDDAKEWWTDDSVYMCFESVIHVLYIVRLNGAFNYSTKDFKDWPNFKMLTKVYYT